VRPVYDGIARHGTHNLYFHIPGPCRLPALPGGTDTGILTPQYGTPGKVRGAFIDQALSHVDAGDGSEHERRLLVARNMLDKGVISQADYDHMISGR
jgi:hypothetical protein